MKNKLLVDIDTERNPGAITVAKPPGFSQPKNREEFLAGLLLDVDCLCEAVVTLIHLVEKEGGRKSQESLRVCVKRIERGVFDADNDAIWEVKPELPCTGK